jgi:hypothetical protein
VAEKAEVRLVWSAVISSFEEACRATSGKNALEFPLIAVPWGAERERTLCRGFWTSEDMTGHALEQLLGDAFPFQGKRHVHLISMKDQLIAPTWGVTLTAQTFVLEEN